MRVQRPVTALVASGHLETFAALIQKFYSTFNKEIFVFTYFESVDFLYIPGFGWSKDHRCTLYIYDSAYHLPHHSKRRLMLS